MIELHWKGVKGNEIAITDDGCVYTIQAVSDREVLQAIDSDGFTRLAGMDFFGQDFDTVDEAKARAQEIEDERTRG